MGYIEDRKAEGERQALEAAKKAEATRVLNQGAQEAGLAQMIANYKSQDAGYSMMDPEEYHALVKQQREEIANKLYQDKVIQDAYNKAAAARFNASKQYSQDLKTASTIPQMEKYVPVSGGMDDDNKLHDQALQEAYAARDRMNAYNKNVDPGLAAKWTADMAAFK